MGTAHPDPARLVAQLDRLRAALHPPGEWRGSPLAVATELLAFGPRPTGFVAVRVRHTALARPGGGGTDWRLTLVALTGLDAEGMRFVPLSTGVERDLLELLGLGAARAGRGSMGGCTSSHVLIRDECGAVRPRPRRGGAAAAR